MFEALVLDVQESFKDKTLGRAGPAPELREVRGDEPVPEIGTARETHH